VAFRTVPQFTGATVLANTSAPRNSVHHIDIPRALRRSARAALAVALILVAFSVASVETARAGSYAVNYCRTDAGGPIPVIDWVQDNNRGQVSDSTFEGCANSSEYMGANWTANGSRPNGALTGWRLDALGGLRVSHWRSAGGTTNQTSPGGEGQIAGWYADGVTLGACTAATGCRGGAVNVDSDINATKLEFNLRCAGTCQGFADMRAFTNVVTFTDANPPTGSASGPLTQSGFANPLSGPTSVTVSAADEGSGIQYADVQIDGKSIVKTTDQCGAPYRKMQPCPSRLTDAGSTSLTLNTAQVADGTHAALVSAVDASGNTTVLWQGPIVVQNSPTVGPGSDANLRGTVNGVNGGDDQARVSIAWPSTARKASARKSVVRACKRSKRYRAKHRVLCNGKPASTSVTTSYSSRRTVTLGGTLRNAAGQPIAGATLGVVRQPLAKAAPPVSLGSVLTDPDGRWSLSVPIAPGTARLAVSYKTHARDTVALTRTATIHVRGRTTLVVDDKSARVGQRVTFAGGLVGKTGSRRNVTVSLQVFNVGRWRTFANPQTDARGKWKQTYRFTRGQSGKRYRFRARPRVAGTYPYSSGNSPTVRVRVR
jgi:hypothetical protein